MLSRAAPAQGEEGDVVAAGESAQGVVAAQLSPRHRREDRTISFDDPAVNLDPLDERASPDQVASFSQTRDAVRAAMTSLSPAQREAVDLAFFKGLTHVEIAEKLGQPLGTIKTRIRQGLIRLKKRLD